MTEEKLICFTKDELLKPREIILEIMDFMVKAGLTDYTGGNMALRIGEKIYSTQTKASIDYRWKLHPDDIIVTDVEQNILEGRKEKLSSEADLHHGILKRFPGINCTLHGNTHYSPLIVSEGIKVKSVMLAAQEFGIGTIAVVPEEYPMFSEEEKNYIYDAFNKMEAKGEAMVVIMPDHGTMVAAENHNKAFVLFNALEANSKYIYDKEVLRTGRLVSSVFENIGLNAKGSGPADPVDVYKDGKENNILTTQDIEELSKKSSSKKITIKKGSMLTSMAESRARELGIEIIRE
ncbi:MAG: class II aldolase/adducin family protein [Candidatus Humimicrobiaceae bacterium]